MQSLPKIWQSATPTFIMGYGPRTTYPARHTLLEEIDASRLCFSRLQKKMAFQSIVSTVHLGKTAPTLILARTCPFALLYFLAAAAAARLILKHYPPAEDGWFPGAIMLLFVSLVFALVGTMLGESWSFVAETYRLGNSHMSLRADRLVWARHRTAFFVAALIVFWLASAERYRRMRYGGLTKALA